MRLKYRRIYFWSLFTVSIIVLTTVVFLISGYRINLNSKQITTTSSIYIDTEPQNAQIYLNESLYKKSTPVLINNLSPRKYNIKLIYEDRHTWEKSLEVDPKRTIIIPKAILFKKNQDPIEIKKIPEKFEFKEVDFSEIKKEFSDFTFPKYQVDRQILFYNDHEIWIWNAEDEVKNLIVRQSTKINEVIWHPSGGYVIFVDENGLKIIETDTRDYQNVYEFLDYSVNNLQTDEKGENIYFKNDSKNWKLNIL